MKAFFTLIFTSLTLNMACAQAQKVSWFADKCIFPMLEYDLLEVQPYAGIFLLQSSKINYDGVYIPVNLGFRKSFLQWQVGKMDFDLALGAASFTQFDVARYDQQNLRGGLLNTDFKASGFLFASAGRSKFRLQLFHVSSHLGDDYILRNNDFSPNDKSDNYEQVDVTYLYPLKNADLYAGLGYIITGNVFRERLMIQTGTQASFALGKHVDLRLGGDIKLYEENNFAPDTHFCSGVTIHADGRQQINISIDAFVGRLPYSTLNFGRVSWLGLSSHIYL